MGTTNCNNENNCSPISDCTTCYPVSKLGIPESEYAEMAQPVLGIQADGCIKTVDMSEAGGGALVQTKAPLTGDGTTGNEIGIQNGTALFDVVYFDPSANGGNGQWLTGRLSQPLQSGIASDLSGTTSTLYIRVTFKRMLGQGVVINIVLFNSGFSGIVVPPVCWFNIPSNLANIFPNYNPSTAPPPPDNGGFLFDYAGTLLPGIYQFPFVAVEASGSTSVSINGFFSKRTDQPSTSIFALNRLGLSYNGNNGINLSGGDYISGQAILPIRNDNDW